MTIYEINYIFAYIFLFLWLHFPLYVASSFWLYGYNYIIVLHAVVLALTIILSIVSIAFDYLWSQWICIELVEFIDALAAHIHSPHSGDSNTLSLARGSFSNQRVQASSDLRADDAGMRSKHQRGQLSRPLQSSRPLVPSHRRKMSAILNINFAPALRVRPLK